MPSPIVGVGLLRRTAGGALYVDACVTAFATVLVLDDGAVAWQPIDLLQLSAEQLHMVDGRLRQQLELVEQERGRRNV